MKKPTARTNKQAKRLLNGLSLSWQDQNPESELEKPVNAVVSHANPVLRLMARDIFNSQAKWILEEANLSWNATIETVFTFPCGTLLCEKTNLTHYGKLCEINEAVLDQITKDKALAALEQHPQGKPSYTHTNLKVTCFGTDLQQAKLAA